MRGGRIFISYRRDDSRADSGRLYDRLQVCFSGRVFRDVASLEPGVEWDDAIARVLSQSDACIVVIGKHWLNITDAFGRRRIDDPNDVVRQEIAAVLKRQLRVLPVLVGGAKMPAVEDLPPDLRPLCRRHAMELTEQDWDEGVQKLVKALEAAFAASPEPAMAKPPQSRRNWWLWASAALATAIGVTMVMRNHPAQPTANSAQPAFQFVGNWRAVVATTSHRLDEDLEVYPDSSLRFLERSNTVALGKWQSNSAASSLEASGIDLKNNLRFSCAWNNVSSAQEGLSGICHDTMHNAWTVSLSRAPGHPAGRSYNLPRVDLSAFTTAERAAFLQLLSSEKCRCGMTVLTCVRTHPACPYGPRLAHGALTSFLGLVR